MPELKPNAELAYAAMDAALLNRRHFDMDSWCDGAAVVDLASLTAPAKRGSCGTTACLAGWAVVLSGYRVNARAAVIAADSGEIVAADIQSFAAELLGITYAQSEDLFFVDNDEIEDEVAAMFGPRPNPKVYGSGCSCTYLGEGTPEHERSGLCLGDPS